MAAWLVRVRLADCLRRWGQLRDIEILVQQQLEVLEGAGSDDETLREIQKILYSTEVGVLSLVPHVFFVLTPPSFARSGRV